MPETKQYNYCLDFIKGIACICVVFMHCEFPGLLGTAVQTVSRFCVPLFFIVSGYFCYFISADPEKINSNMARKIKHVGKITLYACVAYILFDVIQYFVFGKSVFYFNKGALLNLLLFNQPFVIAGQYWFLFALLYDYVLFALVLRVHKIKSIYFVATIMIFVYIILAQGMHLAGIKIPNMYYRNFFVEGLCFFTMGNWIHAYKSKLTFRRGGGGGNGYRYGMYYIESVREIFDGARFWSEHSYVSPSFLPFPLCCKQSEQTCRCSSNNRKKIFYVRVYYSSNYLAYYGVYL